MNGAIWGALGAVAGSAVTAIGGYLGPARASRAAAREQARQREEQRAEGQVERLIAYRAALREWEDYLRDVVGRKRRGLDLDAVEVHERVAAYMQRANEAGDALMRDQWWTGSEKPRLRGATSSVLSLVSGTGSWTVSEVEDRIDRARDTRRSMQEEMIDRLARIAEKPVHITREAAPPPPEG